MNPFINQNGTVPLWSIVDWVFVQQVRPMANYLLKTWFRHSVNRDVMWLQVVHFNRRRGKKNINNYLAPKCKPSIFEQPKSATKLRATRLSVITFWDYLFHLYKGGSLGVLLKTKAISSAEEHPIVFFFYGELPVKLFTEFLKMRMKQCGQSDRV